MTDRAHDPELRDRVLRLLGVLRRAALARSRPVRHLRGHPGLFALVDVAERVGRPSAPGEELLRVERPDPDAAAGDPTRRTFDALHDLARLVADAPESVELVLAAGLLHVPGAVGGVHVHLLTQPVRIDRDPDGGALVCRLGSDAGLRWEDDEVLAGTSLLSGQAAEARERVLEKLDSALDGDLVAVLGEWAGTALTREVTVGDAWHAPAGDEPQLVPAPAVVARRVGTSALREHHDRLLADLADPAAPVPLGLAQLVEAVGQAERAAWLAARDGTDDDPLGHDPLLPLSPGAADTRILERLRHDSGVVVEGPPGTGKTHTIANLVCALLAQGRRVLVTGEKAQALRVLRDELPPPVRDLCVALTGSDDGPDELAEGVERVAARSTAFDADAADREIEELTGRRAAVLAERDALLDELVTTRAAEAEVHRAVAPGFAGTAASIAREVVRTRDADGWLAALLGPDTVLPPAPPVTGSEVTELRRLLASEIVDPRRGRRRDQVLPPPAELPPESHVADLVATVGARGPASALVAALCALPSDAAEHLTPACRRAADALVELEDTGEDQGWARGVADAVLAGRATHAWARAVAGLGGVDAILEHDRLAGPVQVRVAEGLDVRAAAEAFERFAELLDAGGAVRRVFKSEEQKAAETVLAGLEVRGAQTTTPSGARAVAHHLRIVEITDALAAGFAPLGHPVRRSEHRGMLVEQALALRATCLQIGSLLTAAGQVRAVLVALPAARRPRLDGLPALQAVCAVALEVAGSRAADSARRELADIVERVQGGTPGPRHAPELHAVVEALRRLDVVGYVHAVEAVDRARVEHRSVRRADVLTARVGESLPGLLAALRADPSEGAWADREARWTAAWAHARAVAWLAARTPPDTTDAQARLDELTPELAGLTERLATARAWRACLGRLDAEQVRALHGSRSSLAAVGRGTGRHADRFRRAAREAVAAASGAVPAWVMPIHRVLALVEPATDVFDVLVVDEASQADLTSLVLLRLAPRVIVVGDDRQCTPAEAGAALEPVFARLETELADVPGWLRSQFTPRSSLFSVFRTTSGPPLRLREHFRSAPEIIAWSSREFYGDAPLVPVRRAGAGRLPPLRTTAVPDAVIAGEGSGLTNPAEAAAVVDAVVAAAADPAYDGQSFGVVVLQGHGQVELIDTLLRERLDRAESDGRRLRVGVPADFQGDERGVVWLSMVVAPGHRLVSLTADRYRQGFNVAASRARDQLWVVHSVLAADLAPADLRRHLLEHMVSEDPRVLRSQTPERFDSRFEQQVHDELVARGLRVTPHLEVQGRRIDLLVEGGSVGAADAAVVVECDGAVEVPAATRRAEAEREQELRARGWSFVRVRESDHELDPQAALAPVLAALGV